MEVFSHARWWPPFLSISDLVEFKGSYCLYIHFGYVVVNVEFWVALRHRSLQSSLSSFKQPS
jgi:hypothetical protein